jgi:hypothetical protein
MSSKYRIKLRNKLIKEWNNEERMKGSMEE